MTFSSADTRVTEFHLGDYNTFQENSEAILSVPFNDGNINIIVSTLNDTHSDTGLSYLGQFDYLEEKL